MDNYLLTKNRRIITSSDIEGENKLKLFDKIGLKSSYTDFAYALLGPTERPIEGMPQPVRYEVKNSDYWGRNHVYNDDIMVEQTMYYIGHGARIVTNLPMQYEDQVQYDDNNVPYVYYGMYPQRVATKSEAYNTRMLRQETEDRYVFSDLNAFKNDITSSEVFKRYAKEYSFDGRRYVDMRLANVTGKIVLGNGFEAEQNDFVMFRVEPIKWYLDEETGLLVSDKVLSASIPYDYMVNHEDTVKRLTKRNKNL